MEAPRTPPLWAALAMLAAMIMIVGLGVYVVLCAGD